MPIEGIKAFFILAGAVATGLILAIVFIIVVSCIGFLVEDHIEERKNNKKDEANLHITVDKNWKEKMK